MALRPKQPELSAEERAAVASALRHFDGERYRLIGFVVMNDHVHVVVTPLGEHALAHIVQSWKSYTANRFQRGRRREGVRWEREYFDRIIRDERELLAKLQYVLENARKRWPEAENYPWVWFTEGEF